MYYARTVLSRYVVTRNYPEGVSRLVNHLVVLQCRWLNPRHQLLIARAYKVCSLTSPKYLYFLCYVTLFVFLWLEVGTESSLGKNVYCLLARVRIRALDGNVVYLWSHAESCV